MATYNTPVVTNAGTNLISQALIGNITLNFTNFKLSNHQYPSGTDYETLTDMEGIQLTNEPTSITHTEDNTVVVNGFFQNTEVTTAFQIWNIGLYAQGVPKDGSAPSEETLFSITATTVPDTFPANTSDASIVPKFTFEISNNAEITITVNPSGTATIQDIIDVRAEIQQRAPIPHVDSAGIYGIASNSQYGHVMTTSDPSVGGADTVPNSQALLQVYNAASPKTYTGTLTQAGWTGSSAPYTQTVIINGINTNSIPTVEINKTGLAASAVIEMLSAWGNAGLFVDSVPNGLTFSAFQAKPEIDINFFAVVVG